VKEKKKAPQPHIVHSISFLLSLSLTPPCVELPEGIQLTMLEKASN
jgi:hypothetical protein